VTQKGEMNMTRNINFRRLFTVFVMIAAIGLLAALAPPPAHAQLSGAVFTSLNDGTSVNLNLYEKREDVYLNGGPQNQNSAGLPFGTYYFQVTDPNGSTLLSTDNAVCRQVVVGPNSQGKGVVKGHANASVIAGCAHANGTLDPSNGSIPVQLIPFNFTPNAGGEYKVWLIAQTSGTSIDGIDPKLLHFNNSDAKTDNFKVEESESCSTPPCEPEGSLVAGFKFYDANLNGIFDPEEVGIPLWKIQLFGTAASNTTTDLDGAYAFVNLAPGTYGVCEVIPQTAPSWVPTTPTSITGILVPPDSEDNNFGNVCLGAGGGKTLGFWSNKNGQAKMNDGGSLEPELALLRNLNLRDAAGNDFNPTSYAQFRKWLLSAKATNMAYMLSAQLATMELNVEAEFVSANSMVHAGAAPLSCNVPGLSATGFISIANLMDGANSASNHSLFTDANTTASGVARSCQEFMKNALDNANNNVNFVQATACDVNYSGSEPSCAP